MLLSLFDSINSAASTKSFPLLNVYKPVDAISEISSFSFAQPVRTHTAGAWAGDTAPMINSLNDASTDSTETIALDQNVKVITLPFNLHTGGAFKAGLEYANQFMPGYPVVQFDGDGQHRADQIPKLLEELENGTDIVIGSRFLGSKGYQSERTRRLGIRFFSAIVSFVTKETITDVTSGFRAMSPLTVRKLKLLYPSEYPDAGALVLAHRLGLSIKEVSVDMKPRKTGKSHFRHIRSLLYPPRTIVSILAGALGKDN